VEADHHRVDRVRLQPAALSVGRPDRGHTRQFRPVGPDHACHHRLADPAVAVDIVASADQTSAQPSRLAVMRRGTNHCLHPGFRLRPRILRPGQTRSVASVHATLAPPWPMTAGGCSDRPDHFAVGCSSRRASRFRTRSGTCMSGRRRCRMTCAVRLSSMRRSTRRSGTKHRDRTTDTCRADSAISAGQSVHGGDAP
jgi:hypothetical protein